MSNENFVASGEVAAEPVVVKTKRKNRKSVPRDQFFPIWQAASNVKEVSEKTGLPVPTCSAKAAKYRSEGWPLKNMPRTGGPKLTPEGVDALLALIASSQGITLAEAKSQREALLAKHAK